MAKMWYPVVDIVSCIECGTCVEFCRYGVFDKAKVPVPVVTSPLDCVYSCHQCGDRCPVGAISYVGDTTGWIPPVFRVKGGMPDTSPRCGCSCGRKL